MYRYMLYTQSEKDATATLDVFFNQQYAVFRSTVYDHQCSLFQYLSLVVLCDLLWSIMWSKSQAIEFKN